MAGKFLIDTNTAIGFINGDPRVQAVLTSDVSVYVPVIVIGELFFGAFNSTRVSDNIRTIHQFITANVILKCDEETAEEYGQIKVDLKVRGRPIPDNDIWIAAFARQFGLDLLTRDKHFDEVKDISVKKW
jgi:tRNA(fMet)-specific endonuclease VapC